MIDTRSECVLAREESSVAEQGREFADAVAAEARAGLLSTPKTLSPWLFYDEAGSGLFDRITTLPEYYLTRTERRIFAEKAQEILLTAAGGWRLTVVELGAGTAAKTGLLLRACVSLQGRVLYAPIDVSPSALEQAKSTLERDLPGVTVRPQITNYVTEPLTIPREPRSRVLALYIGSSIGNFSPDQAQEILKNVRKQMSVGDGLLLGTDLAPGASKTAADLIRAYDDAAGVTAAFNVNILARLNRELRANFELGCFAHRAVWNAEASRMEMHLVSRGEQRVTIPANTAGPELRLRFADGETIHTENSYKFTSASIDEHLRCSGFAVTRTWHDANQLFAVTLTAAV